MLTRMQARGKRQGTKTTRKAKVSRQHRARTTRSLNNWVWWRKSGSRNSPGQFALDVSRSGIPDEKARCAALSHSAPHRPPHSGGMRLAGVSIACQGWTCCLHPSHLLKACAPDNPRCLGTKSAPPDAKPRAWRCKVAPGL